MVVAGEDQAAAALEAVVGVAPEGAAMDRTAIPGGVAVAVARVADRGVGVLVDSIRSKCSPGRTEMAMDKLRSTSLMNGLAA